MTTHRRAGGCGSFDRQHRCGIAHTAHDVDDPVTDPEQTRPRHDYSSAMAEKKITGPASYFPSIEKTYGKPISRWKSVLEKMKDARHSEMVAMLKAEHGLGHGHANAIVAHFRSEMGL